MVTQCLRGSRALWDEPDESKGDSACSQDYYFNLAADFTRKNADQNKQSVRQVHFRSAFIGENPRPKAAELG